VIAAYKQIEQAWGIRQAGIRYVNGDGKNSYLPSASRVGHAEPADTDGIRFLQSNFNTARKLGLTVPQHLLSAATS